MEKGGEGEEKHVLSTSLISPAPECSILPSLLSKTPKKEKKEKIKDKK